MTRGAELNTIAREGKRLRTEHLEIRVAASLLNHPRVGLIVPKLKHTVVERNRLKRRLREIVRTRVLAELPAIDLVIRARAEAYDATFNTLAGELSLGAAKLRSLVGR